MSSNYGDLLRTGSYLRTGSQLDFCCSLKSNYLNFKKQQLGKTVLEKWGFIKREPQT